jgi:hypothetical protein
LALVDQSIAALAKANKPLHLPAFLLAKGSAFASGEVPEDLLAKEFFAKAMMQARQESSLPFTACGIGTRAYLDRAWRSAESP